MVESDLFSSESVPTCVGCSLVGGGLLVNLGSQRMELAVVSWLAMVRGDAVGKVLARGDVGLADLEEGEAAVLTDLRM